MHKKKSSQGFTVIELLMGMLASSILALTVGLVIYYGWQGWLRNVESVSMQRDAMIAMRVIEKKIRNAADGSISWSVGTLKVSNNTVYVSSQINPNSDVVVQSFNISTNAEGGVEIGFGLQTASSTDSESFKTVIYPRN
jgi:prepilin-type N-terminal cleavage/methylation domain-containing protein